eukprot:403358053
MLADQNGKMMSIIILKMIENLYLNFHRQLQPQVTPSFSSKTAQYKSNEQSSQKSQKISDQKKKSDFSKIIKSPGQQKQFQLTKLKEKENTFNNHYSDNDLSEKTLQIGAFSQQKQHQSNLTTHTSIRSHTNERGGHLPNLPSNHKNNSNYKLSNNANPYQNQQQQLIDQSREEVKKSLINQYNQVQPNQRNQHSLLSKISNDTLSKQHLNQQQQNFKQQSLLQELPNGVIKCLKCNCQLTFDKVKIHERVCTFQQKNLSTVKIELRKKKAPQEKKPPAFVQRPRTLICYICGREYGTASLQIHLKTCRKKWETEESFKPAHQRRPVPEPPRNFDMMISGARNGDYNFEDYNEEAFKDFNEKALVPCHNCKRTFLPDRLIVHLRSCNKEYSRKNKLGL